MTGGMLMQVFGLSLASNEITTEKKVVALVRFRKGAKCRLSINFKHDC